MVILHTLDQSVQVISQYLNVFYLTARFGVVDYLRPKRLESAKTDDGINVIVHAPSTTT